MLDGLWWVPSLIVFGGAALVVLLVVAAARRRALRRRAGELRALDDLQRRAAVALVRADDDVRSSRDELGFAVAQFGEDSTSVFTAAVVRAEARLREAFALKQKLEDAVPDTDAERREWNERILALCASAERLLAEQATAFEGLRAAERDALAGVGALQEEIEEVGRLREAVGAELSRLEERYAAEALAPVLTNLRQADELLVFARQSVERMLRRAHGASGTAAPALAGAARESALRARQLCEAVRHLEKELDDALALLPAAVPALRRDLAEARTLGAGAGDPRAGDAVLRAVSAAELVLQQADRADARRDPLNTVSRLRAAGESLDSALARVRSERERQAHAEQALAGALATARSALAVTGDFIAPRVGAIGPDARTRLAEAERHLSRAETETDPVVALDAARRAHSLAMDADALARYDASGAPAGYPPGARRPGAPSARRGARPGGVDGPDDVAGAVGALLGGVLLGGVMNRGWGRDRWDAGDFFD